MKSEILLVKSVKENLTISDFFKQVSEQTTINNDFIIARLNDISIKDKIKEIITEQGISSLFNFHMTCDAVLHAGITVDEIEEVILGFVKKLNGVKNLLITDQFLYSDDTACIILFEKIINEISKNIESVTFLINKKKVHLNTGMHDILRKISPNIKITEIITDEFHDRFWIDVDNSKGIVMGTSLNGIGKKIALIDHLKSGDVREIIKLVENIT